MAKVKVLVTVDTQNIAHGNENTTVVLSDNNGGSDKKPGDSSTFLISAKDGQKVKFRIKAKNGTTKVHFLQFNYESGDSGCFDPLPMLSNKWNGVASGKDGDSESFSFTFCVEGNTNSPFTLDPDLQIDPPG